MNDTARPGTLGAALNNAGRLVRAMEARERKPRLDCAAGSLLWYHSLRANGSIVSELFRVRPGGDLEVVEG